MESLIITAAHFDPEGTQIKYVLVGIPPERPDRTVDSMRLLTREQLIESLKKGKRFITAHKKREEWAMDGEVRLLNIGAAPYIRIDDMQVAVDDLGNLAKIRSSI
jgi:hypothetical protein